MLLQGSLGMGSLGSCCFKDEQRDAWCAQVSEEEMWSLPYIWLAILSK
jgi:hypothetical protein